MPSKTTVSSLITQIKRQSDMFGVASDSDADDLIIDLINDSLKSINQLFQDYGIYQEVSASVQFKTVENQAYVDITKARIVGDVATFTAVAGDKITVTIDGVAYITAALTGAVLVATVVTAINLATLAIGDVASESDDGYLVITSPTSGATSSVVIADNAGTPASRLFTVTVERSQSAISDLDEIIKISERNNDSPISVISYDEFINYYTDPTANYATSPVHAARWLDRLYFGPTPGSNIYIYLEYIKAITEVASTSTLPFSNKYDPLISAMVIDSLTSWKNPNDAVAKVASRKDVQDWEDRLIRSASRNYGMTKQSQSRNETNDFIGPRRPLN